MSDQPSLGEILRRAERNRQQRRWGAQSFATSTGGVLRVPNPSGVEVGGFSASGGDVVVGHAPIGEILRCNVIGHLSPGGEPIVWDSTIQQSGFDTAVVPGVEIRLPHTAVYGIEGDLSWIDGFVGGGQVHLLLNGVGIPGLSPIRSGTASDTKVGKTFGLAQEFIANKDDRLRLVMDFDGEHHHDLAGVVEIATKEPLVRRLPSSEVASTTSSSGSFNTNSGSTVTRTWTVGIPAGAQPGDIIVTAASIWMSATTNSLTMLPGWNTLVFDSVVATQGKRYMVVWRKLSVNDMSGNIPLAEFTIGGLSNASQRQWMTALVKGAKSISLVDNAHSFSQFDPWEVVLAATSSGPLVAQTLATQRPGTTGNDPNVNCIGVMAPTEWTVFGTNDQATYKGRQQIALSGSGTSVTSRVMRSGCDPVNGFVEHLVSSVIWRPT
jgi:hypothetical protein